MNRSFKWKGPLAQVSVGWNSPLNIVNYQTLIATKAARIRSVIDDEPFDGIWDTSGSRNGCGYLGNSRSWWLVVPMELVTYALVSSLAFLFWGTHAHALVQGLWNDYEAFKAYAATTKIVSFLWIPMITLRIGFQLPFRWRVNLVTRLTFLGCPHWLWDIAYISKKVRQQLDEAGFTEAKIYASNDLDENTIPQPQDAKGQDWRLGRGYQADYSLWPTSSRAVYKVVAIEDENGQMRNTIKLSNNAEKVSTPGKKQVWRITSREKGKSEGDYITYDGVDVIAMTEIKMFHPTLYLHQEDCS